MSSIGRTAWVIAEGYIPETSVESGGEALLSHETACILNATESDARVEMTIYFSDRDPAGPYRFIVGAKRTRHVRFNDLVDPEPVPRGTDYASVITSDQPVVVQHTRLDSRHPNVALLSTVAWPAD